MNPKKIILFLFFYPVFGIAQWQNLGYGFDREGKVMFYDSSTNLLYVGGTFHHADSILVNEITKWDGSHWDSLGIGAPYGAPVYSLTKYQGKLFASSIFQYFPSGQDNWLWWWNGQHWDTLNQRINDAVFVFKEYNNNLYLGGAFSKIGQMDANQIAVYDGLNYSSFPFPSLEGYQVFAIEFFQGDMYVGGNFYDTLTGVNDLERWDGSSFQPFGGHGLASGNDWVACMQVYNNELYIGGWFTTAAGDPANYIMKWDGNHFSNVGNGLTGDVDRMHVYNGELYVCGRFSFAGSTGVSTIVKWDGSQWSAVCPGFANFGIGDFALVNNDLYLTGVFTTIDSIPMNCVAKYAGVTQVSTIFSDKQFKLSPNPCSQSLILNSVRLRMNKYKIYNTLGSELLSKKININNCNIDVRDLAIGIYFLQIETDEGNVVKKFVKE